MDTLIDFGATGIRTTRLGLGCARLGSILTPLDARGCRALVSAAYESGMRHFDTASTYGQGDSERHLGAALREHRDRVCIASKAGHRLSAKQAVLGKLKTPIRMLLKHRSAQHSGATTAHAAQPPRHCFEPAYLERSLHASLRRLRTDYLDIFYLHSPPPEVLADPRIGELAERLRRDGKIRAFGVYCDDAALARAAFRMPAAQIVQFEADPLRADDSLLDEAARSGKFCVLKRLSRLAAMTPDYRANLDRVLQAALSLPQVGAIVVGTTQRSHLLDNVDVYRRVQSRLAQA